MGSSGVLSLEKVPSFHFICQHDSPDGLSTVLREFDNWHGISSKINNSSEAEERSLSRKAWTVVQVNLHEKRRIVGSSLINPTRKSDRFFPPALQAKAFSTKLERDLRIVLWQPSEVVTFYEKSRT